MFVKLAVMLTLVIMMLYNVIQILVGGDADVVSFKWLFISLADVNDDVMEFRY